MRQMFTTVIIAFSMLWMGRNSWGPWKLRPPAAGEDVGAEESAEGELGAVGAATYGADCGGRASLGDGLAGFPQLAPSDVPCGQLHFPP